MDVLDNVVILSLKLWNHFCFIEEPSQNCACSGGTLWGAVIPKRSANNNRIQRCESTTNFNSAFSGSLILLSKLQSQLFDEMFVVPEKMPSI